MSRFVIHPKPAVIRTMIAYLTESHRVTEKQIGQAMRQAITEGANMETILDKWEKQWWRKGHREGSKEGRKKGREEGREEGLQLGVQVGLADLTLRQLHQLIGALDPATEERIRALPVEKLTLLGESLLGFRSSDDLEQWLQKQSPLSSPARKRARN